MESCAKARGSGNINLRAYIVVYTETSLSTDKRLDVAEIIKILTNTGHEILVCIHRNIIVNR